MEKKKQSSIEWLVNQLQKSKDWQRVLNEVSQMSTARIDIIGQAKAMHKEEVEQYGAMCCLRTTQKNQWSLEGLYKETFEGQDNE